MGKWRLFRPQIVKIVGSYLLLSLAWILVSDTCLELISDPVLVNQISIIKGWVFVLITAVLLYVQMYRYILHIEHQEELLKKRNSELVQLNRTLCHHIENLEWKERQLSESEIRFRRAVLHAPIPVMIHAEDGEIIALSNVWLEITGYTRQELPTLEAWLALAYRQDYTRVLSEIKKLYALDHRLGKEYELYTQSGQIRHWLFSSGPLGVLVDGRRALISMALDITERKRMENALTEKNRELDQFAYVTSHDLKAPLRAIFNLSQWIEEDLGENIPQEVRDNMDLLRGRVQRMQDMIQGLLEYSRVGRTAGQVGEVNVRQLLQEIVADINIPQTFTVAICEDMPVIVTDVLRLRQVFSNLLDNAVTHHHRENGHITISIRDMGVVYQFSVADDGPGIAAEHHAKIFELFQVLQPRDKKESTGVGLAIVKKIVENQGGIIWVESESGQGAVFRFTWEKNL